MSTKKLLEPEFIPDYSGVNSVFTVDGDFTMDDVKLKLGHAPLSSLVQQYDDHVTPPSIPISSFDDIIPKDVQSSGENIGYLKYLYSKIKEDG